MSNQPSSKKYKITNTRNLWLKAPEGHSFLPINCHLTQYEGHQGPRFTIRTAERWQRCYEELKRAPNNMAAIDSWLGKRNSFQSMPSDEESYKQLGLPDLTGTIRAGWVRPTLKKRLDQCGFDDDEAGSRDSRTSRHSRSSRGTRICFWGKCSSTAIPCRIVITLRPSPSREYMKGYRSGRLVCSSMQVSWDLKLFL